MFSHFLATGSLARRFGLAAAALSAMAVLVTALSSFWIIDNQQERAAHAMLKIDANYSATFVKSALDAIDARMTEVAQSSIIASGLVDSAGKEIYLTPYLHGIQRINGIPVQILFTDFEGKPIASNESARFSDVHLDWLKQRLESGVKSARIINGPLGPEVIAVELLSYSRTKTPEGALLYKFAINDFAPTTAAKLIWSAGQNQESLAPTDARVIKLVDAPALFKPLGFQIVAEGSRQPAFRLTPQYALIFLLAATIVGLMLYIGSRLAVRMTRDLRKLESFSSSVVEHGIGNQRADAGGTGEVAGLARSINHMLDRLYEQHHHLQEERQKLQQLANTIPQLAWMANPGGKVHWFNDRWYEYTGATPEQTVRAGWETFFHPDDFRDFLKSWQHCVASGSPYEYTARILAVNGEFRTFYIRAAPLYDAAGKIVQWFGTNTDITPLLDAEKAARESAERLREGLKFGRMVVWDWQLASGDMRLSDNATDVFGRHVDRVDALLGLLHPDDVPHLQKTFDEAIASRSQCGVIVRMLRADSRQLIWVEISGNVICDGQGKPTLIRGITLDVTERKQAEEELRLADRRKDEFLAMLAHELRNPLAPISTAAHILKLVKMEDPRIHKMSEIISRQVEHMTGLVDDLLDVSRVTRGLIALDEGPLQLAEIVMDAVEQATPLIDAKSHKLAVQLPEESVPLFGDGTRLVQVMTNILNNAAKYTPDGGEISLVARVDAGQVVLTVADNGVGIPAELVPRVFELFTQGERSPDRAQGGLGLGLALVKSLVELHGGSVAVESDGPGKGSRFIVRLPVAATSAKAPSALQSQQAAIDDIAAFPVLIVDDNADAADSLAMLLQADGYAVTVEYAATDAIARAQQLAPRVLLLDIGLPDMDGYELARRLRMLPATADATFIALTGYGHPQDRERSSAAGFDHHLLKPVNYSVLNELLLSIVSGTGTQTTHTG